MSPLVSVVVPTYNHAHFLVKAIQSVIDQTYTNWEMIIVDNHSSDDTDAVVSNFGDPRIQLLKIHNNGVIAASRNMGIRNARGEWIAFLDSDDCWYPLKLETALSADNAREYDVISTNELMVNLGSGERSVLRYGPYEPDFYRVLLLKGNRLSPSATLVRNSFLNKHGLLFNESKNYIAVEDYDLWLRLALAGARFRFLPEVQGEYVIHPGNNSAQLLRQRKNFETLLYDHVFHIQQFNSSPAKLWKQFGPMLNILEVRQLMADGQRLKAGKVLLGGLLSNPVQSARYLFQKLSGALKKNRSK